MAPSVPLSPNLMPDQISSLTAGIKPAAAHKAAESLAQALGGWLGR